MHVALIHQARGLAQLDPTRPQQTNLRRAVSAAYYALFHFLVDQSCRNVMGTRHELAPHRQVLGRAFSHSTMKSACASFAGGTLRKSVSKGLPDEFAIPQGIRRLATAFVDLQKQRHYADYDLTEQFKRSNVLFAIRDVERAMAEFKQLSSSPEKKFFLACLWAWKNLSNR